MPLDPISYKGFLRACANKATTDGITLRALLNGINGGSFSVSMTGQGSFNVSSTSSAGHSVSFDTNSGGLGQDDIGKASELLLEIADWVVAETPALDTVANNDALRLAMMSEGRMPRRNVNRIQSQHCLGPWV